METLASAFTSQSDLDRMQQMLERCSALTQGIGKLPAVPTPDWCDRAALAIATVFPHADVALLLSDMGEGGRIRDVLSVGAAATRHNVTQRSDALDLRVRVEALTGIPWSPDGMRIPEEGDVISRAYARTDLHGTPHANYLHIPANGSLVATAAVVSSDNRARKLITYVILPYATPQAFESMMVVRLGTGLLAKLAEVAIGPGPEPVQWLTNREQEVLDQLVLGHSVKEISEALGRSPHTIHDHVKSLHRKLNANSRGELVAKALGHIPPAPSH